jgi:hypothetical protein
LPTEKPLHLGNGYILDYITIQINGYVFDFKNIITRQDSNVDVLSLTFFTFTAEGAL